MRGHEFKIEHFKTDHPGREFPPWKSLGTEDREALFRRLRISFCKTEASSERDLFDLVYHLSAWMEPDRADAAGFSLNRAWEHFGLRPQGHLCLTFYPCDYIFSMNTADVVDHLDDIWYPASDDLFLFDLSCGWIVWIEHHGYVLALDSAGRLRR